MAINRYSRGPIAADVQSNFIPLPIDLLDRQMQREQTKYDTAKSFIDSAQESVYGVKVMSPDSETLKQITSQYDEQIQKEVERVGGDYGKLKPYAEQLGQKVKKDIMGGHLGAIHNNFVKAQNRLEELNKLRNSGDIRESTYNKHLSEIQAFGGTVEDGNGGYTTMSFSPVTKALEFGKVADDYGTEIADQFKPTGEKYIDAKTASDLIEKNLWNNKEVIANAEDEIWNTYGELSKDKKAITLDAYIKNIAETAGNKLAYRERFKPDKEKESSQSSLNPGIPIRYNILGNKPTTSTLSLDGTDFDKYLNDATLLDNETNLKVKKLVTQMAVGNDGRPRSEQDIKDRQKLIEKTKFDGNKKAKEIVSKSLESPFVQELVKIYKIDINDPSLETLKKIDEKVKIYNSSSASTGVSMFQDEKRKNIIENVTLRSGIPSNVPARNLKTGKQLNGTKEWEAMIANHLADSKDKGKFLYSGSITTTGEVYPKGSDVITYFDPSTNESTDILLSTDINENSQDFLQDRAMAAYNSNNGQPGGVSTFGKHQFLVLDKKDADGRYVIGHFINGKPAE